jgi:MFS family permease
LFYKSPDLVKPATNFSVSKNLAALYIIKIAKWMNFVMPVIVLFYRSNDMSMQDIFTLKAIYSFTLMFFEIPTGYFADLAGRKVSILIGSVLGVAGFLIYSISSGFAEFVVAEVALGISLSLVSGADSALLYDTLKAGKQSEKYTRYEGKMSSAGNFAEAVAGIIGGLLAVISLRTPFFFQTAVAAAAIPAALALYEPPAVTIKLKTGIGEVIKVLKLTLHGNKRLKWAVMFSAVIGASTLTMAWFAQPYFIAADLPTASFGIAWAILNVAVGIAAYHAWRIEIKLGLRNTVISIAAVLAISYIGMAWLPILPGFTILLVFHLFRGFATPTLRNYINALSSSEIRATVLSVRNFIIRLLFVVLGPLFGWITDTYSLQTALHATGMIFGLLSGISLFYFLKHNKSIENQ